MPCRRPQRTRAEIVKNIRRLCTEHFPGVVVKIRPDGWVELQRNGLPFYCNRAAKAETLLTREWRAAWARRKAARR